MFVKLTDTKGNEMWVNPAYVKGVRAKGSVTQVFTSAFGATMTGAIKTDESVEEVVGRLSAAMPTTAEVSALVAMEEEAVRQQQAAAAAAAG